MTFILPDVFCNFCHQAKDLDLCRDPDLEVDDQGNARWKCYICQNPYDNAYVPTCINLYWSTVTIPFPHHYHVPALSLLPLCLLPQ